jgi:hypothetical protein
MISRFSTLPRTTPEIHQTAAAVARISRIVVQAMLPPELLDQVEHRFYWACRGHLEQLREGCSESR